MRTTKEIASYVRQICRDRNISLTKMEEALGFGNGTIGRWERDGKRMISHDKLVQMADFLGISLAELLDEEPAAPETVSLDDLRAMVNATDDPEILRQMWNIVTEKLQNQITGE